MRGHLCWKLYHDRITALNYVEHMEDVAQKNLSRLYRGVNSLHFVDFPDYPNVGDSAIALGNLLLWKRTGVTVEDIHALTTIPWHAAREWSSPIVINGGGNLGGLYPPISQHRYKLAATRRPETLLIQAPQSVHFTSSADQAQFARLFGNGTNTRIAVRDKESLDVTRRFRDEVELSPDSAHILGRIDAPDPSAPVVRLLRRDDESANSSTHDRQSVDWGRDPRAFAIMTWLRWRIWRVLPSAEWVTNHSAPTWIAKAERRLAGGIHLLSAGEVVVTDRLHAMILALQMGRPVVALDNSNSKLSRYADAWFEKAQPDLRFASTAEEAERLARKFAT